MKTLVSTVGSFFLITFIVGCGDNNTNPTDPSSGSAANGGNSSTGGASSSQGGSSNSTATVGGTGTSSGGGNATTGGTGSASSAGSGSGSATSCVALASACQSVNDCCVTGYPLVCNITCQPALIAASGGSTSTGGNGSTSTGNSGSIVCHTNGDSCFADQQCCSKKCDFSGSSPVCINAVTTNPSGTGGNAATGGSSANATGGKSTTGGFAATGGTTGPVACMPTNMSCSTSSAAACCSGVCSNSVCQ